MSTYHEIYEFRTGIGRGFSRVNNEGVHEARISFHMQILKLLRILAYSIILQFLILQA